MRVYPLFIRGEYSLTYLRRGARIARGATYMFVQGLFSSIIGVAYFVILVNPSVNPNALQTAEMGVYAILTFILTLVQVAGTFALPSASTKYIAQYVAEGDIENARSVVARVLQVSLPSSVVVFALLFVLAGRLSATLLGTTTRASLFQILALASFFMILYTQAMSFLQGLQRIREMAAVGLAYTVVEKSLAIPLLYAGWGLFSVVYGWLTGLLVASLAGLILSARFLGVLGKPHPVKPLINFSYPLYFSGILAFAAGWVDQLFLASYLPYLGMYHWALRAAMVPGLVSGSIVIALFPQLSELYAQRGADSLREAFNVSTRYAVLVSFSIIVGLAALAEPVMVVFAGVEYKEAALPLTVLCLAMLPGALGIAIGPTLQTLEQTKTASLLSVASILSNTAACYLTLARLSVGMLGASCSRVFASLVGFGLGVYALRRTLKITFDREMLWKASAASIVMAMAILISRALEMFFYQPFLFPLYLILGAVVYFFSLVALGAIKKQDVELIREYLPSGLKWVAAWLGRAALIE